MPFFDELQARTERARAELYAIPVIRESLAGQVTRAQYVAFLRQAFHHVRHTVPLLMACGSRLPERNRWMQAPIAEYIAEESGHDEWILNDLAACGEDPEAVRRSSPAPETELMVAYVYDYVARRNPVGFFGMVHVLEGTSQALATRAAGAIRERLGLPSEAFIYLSSHGSLDQEHVRFFQGLMNRLEDRDDRDAVVQVSTMVFRLYGNLFRSLPRGAALEAA
jgi:pyrroloquinoline quinone (PQQ) biosynthesis protein C